MTELQKPVSGVNLNLYAEYRFADHIWSQPGSARPDLLELAERCVRIGEHYWLKQPGSGAWMCIRAKDDAQRAAESCWMHGRLRNGAQIDAALIKTFFAGEVETTVTIGTRTVTTKTKIGACPVLYGQAVVPNGPAFITRNGRHYLNVFRPEAAQPDVQHVNLAACVLLMIYRALCNGPALVVDGNAEADLLLAQVTENRVEHLEFRFVMHWLAAIAQRPGINLQTNLWIVGEQQGIGKGLLSDLLRSVLGGASVGNLDQAEVEAGYTDHLFGKCLVIANEFESDGNWKPKQWNKWVKGFTCDTSTMVRARYLGSWETLNISNFLFTSNEPNPIHLDETDRRNMMVQTTDDPHWKDYASMLKTGLLSQYAQDVAAGFAWVLMQVKVDESLIMTAPRTALKAENQASRRSPVEEWLLNEHQIVRDAESRAQALYEFHRNWHRDNCPGQTMLTLTMWGRMMRALGDRGVRRRDTKAGVTYYIPNELQDRVVTAGKRNEAADVIARTAGRPIHVADHDTPVKPAQPDVSAPTAAERVRALLRAREAATRDNVFPFDAD